MKFQQKWSTTVMKKSFTRFFNNQGMSEKRADISKIGQQKKNFSNILRTNKFQEKL